METKTYNGWANRTTWLVMLNVDNTENLYVSKKHFAKQNKNKGKVEYKNNLKDWVERRIKYMPDGEEIKENFHEIDWIELANAFKEEE